MLTRENVRKQRELAHTVAQLQREIAAREQAVQLAQARAAQLDAMLEGIADGVVIYDADGNCVRENAAYSRLFGREPSPAWAALSIFDRGRLVQARTLDGSPIPADQVPFARALRGENLWGAGAVDMLCRTQNGQEVQVQVSASVVSDASGTVARVILVFRDVTERGRIVRERETAVVALGESERKYRFLFEHMTAAFALHELIVDEQGRPVDYRFLEVNPAFERLTGASAAAVLGKTVKR